MASDSNFRSISGSFSQQSMISSLTLPVRLACNKACVSCTAPRQLLINHGFRSNLSKKQDRRDGGWRNVLFGQRHMQGYDIRLSRDRVQGYESTVAFLLGTGGGSLKHTHPHGLA